MIFSPDDFFSFLRSLCWRSPKFFLFLCFFFAFGLLFKGVLWFVHFGASEKDLGYLGLWDCSPFLHRHTNVDNCDWTAVWVAIAVHSTDNNTQSSSEAREATKRKNAPCSMSMFTSEMGTGAKKIEFLCEIFLRMYFCKRHTAEINIFFCVLHICRKTTPAYRPSPAHMVIEQRSCSLARTTIC